MTILEHLSTERLEEYFDFGMAALDNLDEEHLRECEYCQDRLSAIARFVRLRQSDSVRLA